MLASPSSKSSSAETRNSSLLATPSMSKSRPTRCIDPGLLPGVRRREGGRRVYGPDEEERLRFITRLKTLGLSLAEIKELNAVHAIGGSTSAMLARLDELLGRHLGDLDARIRELSDLRDQIQKYRDHVETRREALA